MKNLKSKVVIALAAASFPVMLMFQNCAKQNITAAEVAPTTNFNNISSSADIPPGQDIKYNQRSALNSAAGVQDVSIQILDPIAERQLDIDEAKVDCEAALSASGDGSPHTANESVSGYRGKVILAPRDFGGQTSIESISDAYGKIYVCGLTVNKIQNTGGRLVLINSTVISQIEHHGTIDLIKSDINSLARSNGIIFKHDDAVVAGGVSAPAPTPAPWPPDIRDPRNKN